MSTQQHVSNRSSTTRHALRKQWYRQLKDLVAALEEMSDHPVLDESDQQRLGIRLSNFSADPKDAVASEDEAQYFTPPLPENLPISPCCPSLWGNEHPIFWPREIPEEEYLAELVNDYYDGRHLADIIASHRNGSRWKHPTSWKWSSPGDPVRRGARYTEIGYFIEPKFLVPHVYDRSLKKRPHQILIMVSDHPADESSLFRTEVLVMSSFMRWKMHSMEREQSLVYPVMVISIMNLYKVRILQSHFDGTFHIRRSNMFDFAVDDHEELMKVMMCWLWSTPHGDTTLSTQIPIFKDYPRDDEDDDKKHGRTRPSTRPNYVQLPPSHPPPPFPHTLPPSSRRPVSELNHPVLLLEGGSTHPGETGFQQLPPPKIPLEPGPTLIPMTIDLESGSRKADHKRKKNNDASKKFRERKKAGEIEQQQRLERQAEEIKRLTEERDFYRGERDFFRDMCARDPGFNMPARPLSPRLRPRPPEAPPQIQQVQDPRSGENRENYGRNVRPRLGSAPGSLASHASLHSVSPFPTPVCTQPQNPPNRIPAWTAPRGGPPYIPSAPNQPAHLLVTQTPPPQLPQANQPLPPVKSYPREGPLPPLSHLEPTQLGYILAVI